MLMIQYAPYHCVKETSDLAWQKISNKIFLQKSKKYFEKYLFKLPPHLLLKIKIFKLNFLFPSLNNLYFDNSNTLI